MERDTTTDGRDGCTEPDERSDDATTRRAMLAATAGSGLLATAPGTVLGRTRTPHVETATTEPGGETSTPEGRTSTPGATGPAPPRNLDGADTGRYNEVWWDGPSDPCAAPVSHYVVTREGTRVKTVPAGITRTRVPAPEDLEIGSTVTYGVTAVDAEGNASETATVSFAPDVVVVDLAPSLTLESEADAVRVGESITLDVVAPTVVDQDRAGGTATADPTPVPAFDRMELSVELSTPCAARIADVSFHDAFATTDPQIAADGSSATLAASGFDGTSTDPVALASVEIEGVAVGGTEIDLTNALTDAGHEALLLGGDWRTLHVESGNQGPPAPTNARAGYAVGHSEQMEVAWDGPANPCSGDLSHYVVTLDGSEAATVPAGQNRAAVSLPDVDGTVTYGVTAVDVDGNESEPVTGKWQPLVADYSYLVRVTPERDAVARGETVEATVEVITGPVGSSLEEVTQFEVTVSTSASCVASVRSASYPSSVADTETPAVADDGSAVTLAGGGASVGSSRSVTLGTVEFEALETGGAVFDVATESIEIGGSSAPAGDVWAPLWVTESGSQTGPPAPTDLQVDQAASTRVDLSWTGAPTPCDTTVDHYAISVDGEDATTVPAGVTKAKVHAGSGEHTFGVRSVAADGTASETVTQSFTVATADPTTFLDVNLDRDSIAPGETVTATLEVSRGYVAPDPTIDSEVAVELSSPCAASITRVTIEDGAPDSTPARIAGGGSTLTILPGDGPLTGTFATVELTGRSPGATVVDVRAPYDAGVQERWATLTVAGDAGGPPAVGDNDARPRDPDDDGLYEDVNGNERQDIADAVDLFQNRNSVDPQFFDFNDSGGTSIGDAVSLFRENTG